MSDRHASKIRGRVATPAQGANVLMPAIDPALYQRDDVRRVLATVDVGALYRVLVDEVGLSQRQIATRTGQSQSEVADIIAGRKVESHSLLRRIAQGLDIPPELMGLSCWAADGTYCGEVTDAELPEGVSAEMLRRRLLALGATAAFGVQIKGLGELLDVGTPAPAPLPSQLVGVHVVQVRELTRGMHEAIHAYGSQPQVSSAATVWADRLLELPGAEPVKQALMTAVAELHNVAGWAGLDAGLHNRAMYHYSRALELATAAGDAYLQTVALGGAGATLVEYGHPDDGLKMQQFGQVKSWDIPPNHDRRTIAEACVQASAATTLARMGKTQAAATELAKSRELWQPVRTDPWGDPDGATACLEIERGRLDMAEPFAVASVRRWEGVSPRARTLSAVMLATVHVKAGERGGLSMAYAAITEVTKLSSMQARTRLRPLAEALETRPGGDAKKLARMARQVATTRV